MKHTAYAAIIFCKEKPAASDGSMNYSNKSGA